MKSKSLTVALLLAVSLSMTLPAAAAEPPSTAEFALWYVLGVSNSTDPAYTAAFGATTITGRLSTGIRFNGEMNFNAKYGSLKFYKNSLLPDYDGVSECVQKALFVASTQQLQGPTSTGRNVQLVIKVTGDLQLNEGNQGYDGDMNWTFVEVRSLRSIACEASFYYPERP